MNEIVAGHSQTSSATDVKVNLYAMFQMMSTLSSAPIQSGHDGFSWRTGVLHPWFNGTLCTRPPNGRVDRIIEDTVSSFQAHDINSFTWWLAPDLDPSAWSPHLLAHGFQYDNNTPGMAIELTALRRPQESPLTIRHVKDSQMLAVWSRTLVRGFEMPEEMAPGFLAMVESLGANLPFRHYLGYLDDKPVASSTLFLGAGAAGIYNVATVTEARGRGIGSEMTLAPLYEARDLGYRLGVLQSSRMGYSVYQRLGFQTVCQVDHFYWQAPNG